MLRIAKYAGSFYSRNQEVLKNQMSDWFEAIPDTSSTARVLGIIVPHAGYMYSGSCAAKGFKRIKDQKFDSIIIIHPSHQSAGFDFSISPYTDYESPLGNLGRNEEINDLLMIRENSPINPWYHQNEHSMEIQLPFIKHCWEGMTVSAIMMGNQTLEVAERLALILADLVIKSQRRIMFVVSTDLSHYRTAAKAEALDSHVIRNIETLDPYQLWDEIGSGKCEACGIGGVLALLSLARRLNYPKAEILDYTHSGRVSGDNSQVVGYLSVAVTK
ncbi:MAG: AmmeMemoRadiSam system protein B [Candidatus Cloacimonetes bacterium]|nr:AmmeMemoRadiSam system protein B [Candidatus Cloacimonadota bacterium]